jgi:hypothetical protein
MNTVTPPLLSSSTNSTQLEDESKIQFETELQKLFESARTFQTEQSLSPILFMRILPDLQDLDIWLSSSSKEKIFEKAIQGDLESNLLIILTLISHIEISDEMTCIDLIAHYKYSVTEGLAVIERNKGFNPLMELFLAQYDFLYGENKNKLEEARKRLSFLDSSYPHVFNIAFADLLYMHASSLNEKLRQTTIQELTAATKIDQTGSTLITLAVCCCSQDFLSKKTQEAALNFVRRCAEAGNTKAIHSIINFVANNKNSNYALMIKYDEAIGFCNKLMEIYEKKLNYKRFFNVAYHLFNIYIVNKEFDKAYALTKSFEHDKHRIFFPYYLTFKELCDIKLLNTSVQSKQCWESIKKSYFHPIRMLQALEHPYKRGFHAAISFIETLVKVEPQLLRYIEQAVHKPTLNEDGLTLGPKVLERTKKELSDILEESSKKVNQDTLVTLVNRFNFKDPQAKDYINPTNFAKALFFKINPESPTFIDEFNEKLWSLINTKITPYFKNVVPKGLSRESAARVFLYLKAILSKISMMNNMESNGSLKELIIEMNGCGSQQLSASEKFVYEIFDILVGNFSIEEVFQNQLQVALIEIFNLLAESRPHTLDYLKKLIGHSTKLLSDKETLDSFSQFSFATLEDKQTALDRFYKLWNADLIFKTIYDYIQKLEEDQKNPESRASEQFLCKIYSDATNQGLTQQELLTNDGIENDEYRFHKKGIQAYLLKLGFLSQVSTPISFPDPYSMDDISWIPKSKITTSFQPRQPIPIISALRPLDSTFEESSIVTLEFTVNVIETRINATLILVQGIDLIRLPTPYGLSHVNNPPQARLIGENKVQIEFKLPSYELIREFFESQNFPLVADPRFKIDVFTEPTLVISTNEFQITKKVIVSELRRSKRIKIKSDEKNKDKRT